MKFAGLEGQAYVVLCQRGVSTDGLARALDVSVPTASRAVASLRKKGVQIATVRENGSWHYEVRNQSEIARVRLLRLRPFVGFIKGRRRKGRINEDAVIYGD